MLIEKLNSGILESKGIWENHFVPTFEEGMNAILFETQFVKEYKAPDGITVYHLSICEEESICVMKERSVLKRITEPSLVEKQKSFLSKIEFVGNVSIDELSK